jgi:hypothetical protein
MSFTKKRKPTQPTKKKAAKVPTKAPQEKGKASGPEQMPLAEIARQIRVAHDKENGVWKKAFAEAFPARMEQGRLLKLAKQQLTKHGEFMKWVDKDCPYTHRTANRIMKEWDYWSAWDRNALPKTLSEAHEHMRDKKLWDRADAETDQGEGKANGKNPAGKGAQERQPSQGGNGNSHEGEQPSGGQPSGVTIGPATGETDAKSQEAINVQQPFDQPEKDRLAAVYAQNGPASTPIQLMTNLVIPNLKKVAEVEVGVDDVPFLASAIKEALALLEALKQRYAIS